MAARRKKSAQASLFDAPPKAPVKQGLLFDESTTLWVKPSSRPGREEDGTPRKVIGSGYGRGIDRILEVAHRNGGRVSDEWENVATKELFEARGRGLVEIVDEEALAPLAAAAMGVEPWTIAHRGRLTKRGWDVAKTLYGVPR